MIDKYFEEDCKKRLLLCSWSESSSEDKYKANWDQQYEENKEQ